MLLPALLVAVAASAPAPDSSGTVPVSLVPGDAWNDFLLRRAIHEWWTESPARAIGTLEQRDAGLPETDASRADFLHAYGLRTLGRPSAFLDEARGLLARPDARGWALSLRPLVTLDGDAGGADPRALLSLDDVRRSRTVADALSARVADDPANAVVESTEKARDRNRVEGTRALAEGRWDDAHRILAGVENDWSAEGAELERLAIGAKSGDVDRLWAAWNAAGDGPGTLAISRARTERAVRHVAERALDLTQPPGGAPAELRAEDVVLAPRVDALPPSLRPPTAADRRRIGDACAAVAAARAQLGTSLRALEDDRAAAARDAGYRERGLNGAERERRKSEDVAARADALLARAHDIAADLAGARDEETRRIAARTAAFVERTRRNLVVARALHRFRADGPRRRETLPDGIPRPAEILDLEAELVADLESWFTTFAEIAPGLIARSHDEVWVPRATNGPAAIAALARRRAGRAGELGIAIAAARDAAALPSRFEPFETRIAADREHVRALEDSRNELRRDVAKRTVAAARARHAREGEGIAYALAVAVHEQGVAGGTDPAAADLRREAAHRYTAFLRDHPESPARSEVRFRLADARLQVARDGFRANVERFLGQEPAADDWGRPELAPFVDYGPAVEQYLAILEEDPRWAHRDAVLFHAGMILSDRADPRGGDLLADLVTNHARSPHAAEAHLRLGDERFERGDWTGCLPHFEQAARTGDAGLAAIAMYKIGWARFSLDEFGASARAYRDLLDHYDTNPEAARTADLHEEAGNHLVHSLARGGGAPAFARLFDGAGERPWEAHTLESLGHLLRSFSLFDEAAACDSLWLRRWPLEEGALAAAQRLIETRERADDDDAARAARLALAPRFRASSPWGRARSDSMRALGEAFAHDATKTVALHLHHAARETGNERDWRTALGLYETLLEGWPAHEDAPTFHYYAGEAAEALHEHAAAVTHFDEAAGADAAPFAKDAAWHAVAARDAWYESTRPVVTDGAATGPGSADRARDLLDAIDGFVDLHPADERTADLLWRQGNLAYEHGWKEEAADALARFSTAHPADGRALTAARLRGQALYELERYDAAGSAYATALAFAESAGADSVAAEIRPLLPHCRFRHGERILARGGSGNERAAAGIFEETAARWPAWESADGALYRAGLAWDEAGEPGDAVRSWSALVDRYAGSEYSRDALLKIAETWEREERWGAAAEAYRRFSRTFPEDADASAALLTAADLLEKGGDTGAADSMRNAYLDRYPEDVETAFAILEPRAERDLASVGAGTPISSLLGAAGDAPPSSLRRYLSLATEHDSLASRAILARVRFERGEEARRDYVRARLSQPLEPSIATKKSLLEGALEEYRAASAYGVVPWNRAAAYRIGECLVGFGDALMDSERPADLGGDDLLAYDEVLEERSWDFWDRGEETWTGLLRVAERDADGEWLDRARAELWPRVARHFLHRPEFEHPVMTAQPPEQESAE